MNPLALIPAPYRFLVYVLLAVALWGHGWVTGRSGEQHDQQVRESNRKSEVIRVNAKIDKGQQQIVAKVEERKASTKAVIYKSIKEADVHEQTIIVRAGCELAPERVRNINAAFGNEGDGAGTGEPAPRLPAVPQADLRGSRGSGEVGDPGSGSGQELR